MKMPSVWTDLPTHTLRALAVKQHMRTQTVSLCRLHGPPVPNNHPTLHATHTSSPPADAAWHLHLLTHQLTLPVPVSVHRQSTQTVSRLQHGKSSRRRRVPLFRCTSHAVLLPNQLLAKMWCAMLCCAAPGCVVAWRTCTGCTPWQACTAAPSSAAPQ